LEPSTVKLPHREKKKITGDQEGCRPDLQPSTVRVDHSAGKGTSGGMDKFGSVIDRMNMMLGTKFLNSLLIKTQLSIKGAGE
jgi:hypothetical protein